MLREDLGSIASRILVPLNAGAVLRCLCQQRSYFFYVVCQQRLPLRPGPASSCDVARCVALWGDLQRFPWLMRQNWRWPCGRRPHSRDHTIDFGCCVSSEVISFENSDFLWHHVRMMFDRQVGIEVVLLTCFCLGFSILRSQRKPIGLACIVCVSD